MLQSFIRHKYCMFLSLVMLSVCASEKEKRLINDLENDLGKIIKEKVYPTRFPRSVSADALKQVREAQELTNLKEWVRRRQAMDWQIIDPTMLPQ